MANTRTLQDHDFLVWEVYPTGGRHGFSENPHIVFHCLTRRDLRPRIAELGSDTGEAQRLLAELETGRLLDMLEHARELP
jgi:hypothetical protein